MFKRFSSIPFLVATCLQISLAQENSNKIEVNLPNFIFSGKKLDVSFLRKFKSKLILFKVNILFEKDIFYLFKKSFKNENFDVKISKYDDDKKLISISLKKDKILEKFDDSDIELFCLNLNVSKKAPSKESEIHFDLEYSFDDGKTEKEEFCKCVSVNPAPEIVDIKILNLDFKFSNENKNFDVEVPFDTNAVTFNVQRKIGEKIDNVVMTKKLNKSKNETKLKMFGYVFNIVKDVPKQPEKAEKKLKKKSNIRKNRSYNVNKNKIIDKNTTNKIKNKQNSDKFSKKNGEIEKNQVEKVAENDDSVDITNLETEDGEILQDEKHENFTKKNLAQLCIGSSAVLLSLALIIVKIVKKKKNLE